MLDFISLINKLFHYNRDIDEEQEQIWDIMICGRASDANSQGSRHIIIGYILNIIIMLATYLLIGSAATSGIILESSVILDVLSVIFFVLMFVLTTASFIFFSFLDKFPFKQKIIVSLSKLSPIIRLLISFAVSFVIGLIFCIIAILITFAMA